MSKEIENITQKLWGWKVAAHLFLVAAGAGAYITGFFLSFSLLIIQQSPIPSGLSSPFLLTAKIGIVTALPLLIAGGFFILANLGTKGNAFRVFNRPYSSWLSRGSYVILLFILLDLILIITWIGSSVIPPNGFDFAIASINLILALVILIYSGMLLKVLQPFTSWNSWLLPSLFAASGIATGAMFVLLIAAIYGFSPAMDLTQPIKISMYILVFFLIAQIVVLILYLRQSAINDPAGSSLFKRLKGQRSFLFWSGVVVSGLLLPLLIGLYLVLVPFGSVILLCSLTVILTIFGIAGSYMLRHFVLSTGTANAINAYGRMVKLPETSFISASRQVKYREQ